MRFNKKTLLIISIILFLINAYVTLSYTLIESRMMKLISAVIYFILFLFYKGFKNKSILLAISCFLVSDIFLIYYEKLSSNKLTSLIIIIGYIILIGHVFKRVQLKKINKYLLAFFAILILLNSYALYEVLKSLEYRFYDSLQQIIFYTHGIVIIALCAVAANYNFVYNTNKSMYFMYFSFAFAFSNLTAFLAYYYDTSIFFVLSRFLYVFAFFFVVNYVTVAHEKDEVIPLED